MNAALARLFVGVFVVFLAALALFKIIEPDFEKTTWPVAGDFVVKVFYYNSEGIPDAHILEGDRLSESIVRDVTLTSEQVLLVQDAVVGGHPDHVIHGSEKLIPRHAIVFFDDKGTPIASIEMSFEQCHYRVKPAPSNGAIDLPTLAKILEELEMPYSPTNNWVQFNWTQVYEL